MSFTRKPFSVVQSKKGQVAAAVPAYTASQAEALARVASRAASNIRAGEIAAAGVRDAGSALASGASSAGTWGLIGGLGKSLIGGLGSFGSSGPSASDVRGHASDHGLSYGHSDAILGDGAYWDSSMPVDSFVPVRRGQDIDYFDSKGW